MNMAKWLPGYVHVKMRSENSEKWYFKKYSQRQKHRFPPFRSRVSLKIISRTEKRNLEKREGVPGAALSPVWRRMCP